MKTFSEKLKILRNQQSLTQEQMADKINARFKTDTVTRGDIANYETGRHNPTIHVAKLLARFWNVTLDDLFFDHNTKFLREQRSKRSLKAA